ncbi:MAG: hypothetical protein P9L88_06620 [Candidatus Tantalella remota]|nr:hypothetical protein [Candidatus Tantalella remota]
MGKKILIFLLVVIIAIGFFKNKIIEVSVEQLGSRILGTKLDIEFMMVDVFRPVIVIKGFKLYNPEGYVDRIMIDIPEIYIKYNCGAMFTRRIELKEFKLHLKELNIIKSKEGKVNLDALHPVNNTEEGKQLSEDSQIPKMTIDVLYLKADKVVYKDYTSAGDPKIRIFNIDLDEKYENIDDPYTLVRLIISRVLKGTAISNIVRIPMKGVGKVLKSATVVEKVAAKTVGEAGHLVGGTRRVLTDTFQGILSSSHATTGTSETE